MSKKLKIKLTIPGFGKNSSISQFIGLERLDEAGIEFIINTENNLEVDFWFVVEDLVLDEESANVPDSNVIFLSAEVAHNFLYFDSEVMRKFINQFSYIYTCFPIYSSNSKIELPFLPWMINANHGESIFQECTRSKEWFENKNINIQKHDKISVFCSSQISTEDHRLRFKFVSEVQKYFGESIVWFGNGVNKVDQKWDGIAPFKYHLVIENQRRNNVITEKLYDSYLGQSYPIYYGAPNVSDFFDERTFATIDIVDIEASKKTIKQILESDLYGQNKNLLIAERSKVLNEYNVFERIVQLALNNSAELSDAKRSNVTLHSSRFIKNKSYAFGGRALLYYSERGLNRIANAIRKMEFRRLYGIKA